MNLPTYIYKILPHSSVDPRFTLPIPIPASHEIQLPGLDHDDGFVHTSSAEQIPETLRLFFKDVKAITLLRMDVKRLSEWRKIEWVGGNGVENTKECESTVVLFVWKLLELICDSTKIPLCAPRSTLVEGRRD